MHARAPRPCRARRFAACALPLLLLVVASAAPPAAASEFDFDAFVRRSSAWAGHGVGSMIHRRTSQEMKMPQMPGGGRTMTTEVKETLTAITDAEYVIKVETKTMMGWQTSERREPKIVKVDLEAAKVVDAGEDTITVGGTEYTCTKKTIANMGAFLDAMGAGMEGRGGAKMPVGSGTVWVHPTHGVLKTETTMTMMGQSMTTSMVATKLSTSAKVGDTTYDCREWTMDMAGSGMKRVMLQSPKIPGMTVSATMTMSQQGFSMTSREEIVAYVKKPVAPVTGG